MDPFLPKYKLVQSAMGDCSVWWYHGGFCPFPGQPLDPFSNLRAALSSPGSSTRCPTIARGQPRGAGPSLAAPVPSGLRQLAGRGVDMRGSVKREKVSKPHTKCK